MPSTMPKGTDVAGRAARSYPQVARAAPTQGSKIGITAVHPQSTAVRSAPTTRGLATGKLPEDKPIPELEGSFMRLAAAASAITLTGSLIGLGFTSPAAASESSYTVNSAAAPSCSTRRIDDTTAEGWCNTGGWRLGIQCRKGSIVVGNFYTNNGNYYTTARTDRRSCPAGGLTMSHYWIDRQA
jgi:hypothetical protein